MPRNWTLSKGMRPGTLAARRRIRARLNNPSKNLKAKLQSAVKQVIRKQIRPMRKFGGKSIVKALARRQIGKR